MHWFRLTFWQQQYREVRQGFTSPCWWIRKLYPWSAFGVIAWWWLTQPDRRVALQCRLQRQAWAMNMREIQQFLDDFVRPELWLM
jgi:hypothetical protein